MCFSTLSQDRSKIFHCALETDGERHFWLPAARAQKMVTKGAEKPTLNQTTNPSKFLASVMSGCRRVGSSLGIGLLSTMT